MSQGDYIQTLLDLFILINIPLKLSPIILIDILIGATIFIFKKVLEL